MKSGDERRCTHLCEIVHADQILLGVAECLVGPVEGDSHLVHRLAVVILPGLECVLSRVDLAVEDFHAPWAFHGFAHAQGRLGPVLVI